MKMCMIYTPEILQQYLDGELSVQEEEQMRKHTVSCSSCSESLENMRSTRTTITTALHVQSISIPDAGDVFARVQSTLAQEPRTSTPVANRRQNVWMTAWFAHLHGRMRILLVSSMALAVLLGLIVFTPLQTIADQALQIFQDQSLIYVPVSPARLQQLSNLHVSGNSLFLAKPSIVGTPSPVEQFSTTAEASSALSFTAQEPRTFPFRVQSTQVSVQGAGTYQFQVNVTTLRQIFAVMNVPVTIPDSLGAEPVLVQMPPVLHVQYAGNSYTMDLYEGTTPTVHLPVNVQLAQLGQAGLELLGMDQQQAKTLSQRINWQSTLLFPFPSTTSAVQQVTVNGNNGLLVSTNSSQNVHMLYWQQGDHFYVLSGRGEISQQELVVAADSLR